MEYHSVGWALLQLQGYLSTLGPPNHQHWSHFYPTKSQQKPILPTWHSKITNLQMQKANAIFELGLDGPKVIDVPWKHSFAAGGTRKRRPTGQQKTWSFGGFCGSLGFCQRTGVIWGRYWSFSDWNESHIVPVTTAIYQKNLPVKQSTNQESSVEFHLAQHWPSRCLQQTWTGTCHIFVVSVVAFAKPWFWQMC